MIEINLYKFKKDIRLNFKPSFFYGILVLVIFIPGCLLNPDSDGPSVEFFTNQTYYLSTDTLTVVLKNNSTDVLNIELRCADYLEMYFQKRENGQWSENRWFWYMSLRCPTFSDSILPWQSYSYKLPAEWFHDSGVFRLVMEPYYSNAFFID